MNILITGGAGFVCSQIADKLNDENHNLILLDNLLTGNKKNIEHLLHNKNVKFIECFKISAYPQIISLFDIVSKKDVSLRTNLG